MQFSIGWALQTKPVGKEICFLNPTRDDCEFGSCKINVETGCWSDFAVNGFAGGDVISLVATLKKTSQPEAARLLQERIASLQLQNKVASVPIGNASTSARCQADEDKWELIVPVPTDAPPRPEKHWKFDKPIKTWVYCNEAGQPMAIVSRFNLSDGGKEFHPQTLWLDRTTGKQSWRWKNLIGKRPLYNLTALATKPNAPVLIVEGEKAADAGDGLLFPEWIVVTTMNGSQSPGKRISPLSSAAPYISGLTMMRQGRNTQIN